MSDLPSLRASRLATRPLTPEQQYWQMWRAGTRPDLAAFLAARPSLPSDEAAAVIAIDQYERWLAGDRVPAEQYARLLPDDDRSEQSLCDVVYGEYLLREQLGEHPAIAEYLGRFPAVAGLLSRQVELHRALAEPANADTEPCDSEAETPDRPRIPGYALLEVVGKGGMGVVYKARQVSLDRDVALKVLPVPAGLDPVALERMHREAQITAKLSHPNIVTVFDAGTLPGWFYLAMEYVAGVDLHRLVEQRGPLPVAWACDYVRQAALGLQHAQRLGLVHRDIKPSNLIVSPAPGPSDAEPPGTVKILDLGLARLSAEQTPERSPITQVGTFMGTPDFIAPEQATDPRQADTRSDLYSLGCTFYFLLTGRVPFTGATPMAKVMQHHVEDAAPVEQVRPEVPARVGAVVRRLLAKRPEDRYQTPADLVRALESAVSPEKVVPLPSPPAPPAPPRVRLIRSLVGHADWVKSVAFSGEGSWLASGSLDGSVRVWRPETGQEVWRGEPHAGGVSCVAFSDDGGRLASVGQDRFLCLYDVASRKAIWKTACHERNVDRLAFVLGGAGLLSGGHDGFLRLWDAVSGRQLRAWQAHAGAVWGMEALRDGQTVFTGGQDRALRLWDISTGRSTAAFPEQPLPVTSVEVCVEGKLALSGSLDGRIYLWDLPRQSLIGTLNGHTGRVTDLTLSPDRKTAVSASRDQTLRLWDIAGGTDGEVLTGHTAWVTSVTWSPDGRLIASGSVDRRVCLWNAEG